MTRLCFVLTELWERLKHSPLYQRLESQLWWSGEAEDAYDQLLWKWHNKVIVPALPKEVEYDQVGPSSVTVG